jgi:hypothetical protein
MCFACLKMIGLYIGSIRTLFCNIFPFENYYGPILLMNEGKPEHPEHCFQIITTIPEISSIDHSLTLTGDKRILYVTNAVISNVRLTIYPGCGGWHAECEFLHNPCPIIRQKEPVMILVIKKAKITPEPFPSYNSDYIIMGTHPASPRIPVVALERFLKVQIKSCRDHELIFLN